MGRGTKAQQTSSFLSLGSCLQSAPPGPQREQRDQCLRSGEDEGEDLQVKKRHKVTSNYSRYRDIYFQTRMRSNCALALFTGHQGC